MSDGEAQLASRLDTADKLIKWQFAVISGVIAAAAWCTAIGIRVSALEVDHDGSMLRRQSYDHWRVHVDIATGIADPEYISQPEIRRERP